MIDFELIDKLLFSNNLLKLYFCFCFLVYATVMSAHSAPITLLTVLGRRELSSVVSSLWVWEVSPLSPLEGS